MTTKHETKTETKTETKATKLYLHTLNGRIAIVRAESPEAADALARKRAGAGAGRILYQWIGEAEKTAGGTEVARGMRQRILDAEVAGKESSVFLIEQSGPTEIVSTLIPRE